MKRCAPVLAALVLVAASPAGADQEDLVEVIRSRVAEFDALAHYPLPPIDDKDLQRLVDGKLVRIREKTDDPDLPQRVLGLEVIDIAKEQLWFAARDIHYTAVDGLTEVNVGTDDDGHDLWYQHIDVPRPFADRHWVIDVWDNHALAEGTHGRSWEHPWELTPSGEDMAFTLIRQGVIPGIDEHRAEKAVYTPVNRGAWLAISLPGGRTLFGYHVITVLGGGIPDRLVVEYSAMTLGKLFKGTVERVPDALVHYDPHHEPMIGGDGNPILPFKGE